MFNGGEVAVGNRRCHEAIDLVAVGKVAVILWQRIRKVVPAQVADRLPSCTPGLSGYPKVRVIVYFEYRQFHVKTISQVIREVPSSLGSCGVVASEGEFGCAL